MCHTPLPAQSDSSWLACYAFAAVFCGLDYLVCGTSIADEAAGDLILIFAVSRLLNSTSCVVVVFGPQSFLIKKKVTSSLKPSVANDRQRKCFNSQRPHGAGERTHPHWHNPFHYPCLTSRGQRQSKVSNACNVQRLLAWLSFYFSLGWRTRITWSAPAPGPWLPLSHASHLKNATRRTARHARLPAHVSLG